MVTALAATHDVPRAERRDGRPTTVGLPGGRCDDLTYLPVRSPLRPLSIDRSGPGAVVFEGWLHGRDVLAEAVGRPTDASNAALVGAAYRRWGATAFRFLDGSFALCLFDPGRGDWVATRDRTGTMPLFHARTSRGVVLSPSVEALRRHPEVRATVDRTALAAYLLTEGREVTGTFYGGVSRLLPGHALYVDGNDGRARTERYWSPLARHLSPWVGPAELEGFPARMRSVLARHLALGRTGLFLSGGLDSGTIAALSAEAAQGTCEAPRAYALMFADPDTDEAAGQRGLSQALGLHLESMPVDLDRDPLEAFDASLALNDDWPHPLASTFRSVYLSLGRRAVDDGCEVILTGDGGDEWLAVHASLAADLLRSLSWGELRRLTDTVRATHGLPALRAGKRVLWEYGLRLLLLDAAAGAAERWAPAPLARRRRRLARSRLPDWFTPDRAVRDAVVERLASPTGAGPHYSREVVDGTLQHPLTLLYQEENFESGRRIGAPVLAPFHHPDVVSFLARTPPHLRSLGGRYKGMLRRLLHARFPQLGFDRQRKTYATNFTSAMVYGGLRRGGSAAMTFPALADLGVVDRGRARAAVDAAVRDATDRTAVPKRLWLLLCAERWVRSRAHA